MSEVYFVVRGVEFIWGAALFWGVLYWAIIDAILTHKCAHTHIPPEMQFWMLSAWMGTFSLVASLVEIFLDNAAGGWRVFTPIPFLLVVTWALKYGIHRIRSHRESVKVGACQ